MKSLIEFLARYEPKYPGIVRGYDEPKIRELEEVLGHPLPIVYRDFLSSVGANLGFPTFDINFDIDGVIELAQEKRATLPRLLTPIAVDDSPGYTDYFLEIDEGIGEDGRVVRSGAGSLRFDEAYTEFSSFHDIIFSWGFEYIRQRRWTARVLLSWDRADFVNAAAPPTLAGLRRVLESSGFGALDVTSPAMALFDRRDCAAQIYQPPGALSFSISFAAIDAKTVSLVAETVRDNMPGRPFMSTW